ncbi:MAG TPA: flavodoxin family protein [candidate division Zixibacteria bacterium]
MKLLGIVGSPRERGNSFLLMEKVMQSAKKEKPTLLTEIIQLSRQKIKPCRACQSCADDPYICMQQDDLNEIYKRMKKADGIIFATPSYGPIGACPSVMQAFLERIANLSHLPSLKNKKFAFPLKDKPCGLIVVSIESQEKALVVLNNLEQYVLAYGMKPVHIKNSSSLGVSGKGNEAGDVLDDKGAVEDSKLLGKLLAKAISPQLRLD